MNYPLAVTSPHRDQSLGPQTPDPTLVIATRTFGASGRPWMWRQVVALKAFRKELICWERQNYESQPTVDVNEHIMAGNPAPYDGPGRWRFRSRAIFNGSFYAAIGAERDRLDSLLRTLAPNVLLCHFGDMAMRLLPSARRLGIPVVAYFHGDFPFLKNRWYRWSLQRSMRDLAAIVVVTGGERKWLQEHGAKPEKIHYIPCGAPTDLFRPHRLRDGKTVRFVMVSRLQADKGCDVSIKAFSQVAASNPDVTLDIFGEGEERPGLERLASTLQVDKKVVFHGHVGEAALARALPMRDIFIQHSRVREGSPVSLVEAMACGLPVVSTATGGIIDQVEHGKTGYIVPEEDISGMAHAMASLASDPGVRQSFGLAARERCLARHDSSVQTARLERLLLDVARQDRRC